MVRNKKVAALRQLPHSQNLRLHRLSDTPATFFITKSLYPKQPILDETARETVVSALAYAIRRERIFLRAFVVMPDHWHALFALREPWTLPKFMHDMMSYVGARTAALLRRHGTSCQDGYYDTRVKTAKQFEFVAHYIEQNPVVKKLVKISQEWDANSAKRRDLITEPWPWVYD
jgi:REP element-mobilizing transposase RayT